MSRNDKLKRRTSSQFVLKPRVRIFRNQSLVFQKRGGEESENGGFVCKICKVTLLDDTVLQKHVQSELHQLRSSFCTDRKLLKMKSKVSFLEFDEIDEYLEKNEKKTFKLVMKNVSKNAADVCILRVHELMNTGDVKMPNIPSTEIKIFYGQTIEFPMTVCFTQNNSYQLINVFVVQEETSNETVNLLVISKFTVLNKEYRHLDSKKALNHHIDSIKSEDLPLIDYRSSRNQKFRSEYVVELGMYEIPVPLNRLLNNGLKIKDESYQSDVAILQEIKDLLPDKKTQKVLHTKNGLTKKNYSKRFQYLLWIEEHQLSKDIRNYDLFDVELKKYHGTNDFYELKIAGLAKCLPSLMRGDSVFVIHKNAKCKYKGVVYNVNENSVSLAFPPSFAYISKEKVDVEFALHRISLRIQHRAVQQVSEGQLFHFLFPKRFGEECRPLGNLVFKNRNIANNSQQKQAVENILKNTAYPAPYIIYGPPGTGKTSTLVEAIVQVFLRESDKKVKICACAPFNAAADLIAIRLLTYISSSSVYRLYSRSRSPLAIPDALKPHCNYNSMKKEIEFPNATELKEKTIVVVTPITAGRLYGVTRGEYFDYIFFDEAGHAEEPLTLIPVMGLLKREQSNVDKLRGNLILAGDPKQLGPIIHSELAKQIGLDMSLLERLMVQNKLYQKDPVTGEYNAKVITKLLNNYRSHPILLKIPKELFYDNELYMKADHLKTHCLCSWKKLPVKNFPLLFHGVRGDEKREPSSPSYFNLNEIEVVMDYVRSLMEDKTGRGYKVQQEDIAILSPYRKQAHKFRTFLQKKNWTKIEVKTVEEFQGQEKLIVIISTVRSREEFLQSDYQYGIGFLRNPKRFNVAITRAIALMIVVGNPNVLQTDPNWRKLIEYCVSAGSYNGIRPSGPVPSSLDPNETLALDLSVLASVTDEIPESEKPSFLRND